MQHHPHGYCKMVGETRLWYLRFCLKAHRIPLVQKSMTSCNVSSHSCNLNARYKNKQPLIHSPEVVFMQLAFTTPCRWFRHLYYRCRRLSASMGTALLTPVARKTIAFPMLPSTAPRRWSSCNGRFRIATRELRTSSTIFIWWGNIQYTPAGESGICFTWSLFNAGSEAVGFVDDAGDVSDVITVEKELFKVFFHRQGIRGELWPGKWYFLVLSAF